jgi:hypothetical protein
MKDWKLYDLGGDKLIAESDDYMELYEMRSELIRKTPTDKEYKYDEDVVIGDLKGRWVICTEKSRLFAKNKKK